MGTRKPLCQLTVVPNNITRNKSTGNILFKNIGAWELAHWLRAFVAFSEELGWFPASTRCPPPCVAPGPWDVTLPTYVGPRYTIMHIIHAWSMHIQQQQTSKANLHS